MKYRIVERRSKLKTWYVIQEFWCQRDWESVKNCESLENALALLKKAVEDDKRREDTYKVLVETVVKEIDSSKDVEF